mgnify:CR=1 FL=1
MKINVPMTAAALLAGSTLLLACDAEEGSLDNGGDAPGCEVEGPRPELTALVCPTPGVLPFATQSCGFANPDNEARLSLRSDSSFGRDIVETEDGDQVLEGGYCRIGNFIPNNCGNGLANEWVSFWEYRDDAWQNLGRVRTDDGGRYSFSLTGDDRYPIGEHTVYAVFEATQTCAEHGVFVYPEGTQVIITDIDGTLTRDDNEFITQLSNPSHVPAQNTGSDRLMQTWNDKGYIVVYLTARPNDFRWQSRNWLRSQGFPYGPMETATSFVFGETARTYKRAFVNRVSGDLDWDIVAAYGNAFSDVDAYEDGGIPKNVTFTINEASGAAGTVGMPGPDWTAHINGYVSDQPAATQPF